MEPTEYPAMSGSNTICVATVLLETHEDDAAVRVIGRVDANADLLRALGQLPPRQRVALVLRYFEDLPEADVASVMGCSVGTVKSTTSRALDRLREAVSGPDTATGQGLEGSSSMRAPNTETTPATTVESERSATR